MIIGNLRRQIQPPQKVSHNTRTVYQLQREWWNENNLMVFQLPRETYHLCHKNLMEFQHLKDQFRRNHNNQIIYLLQRDRIPIQWLTKSSHLELKAVKDKLLLHLNLAKDDLLQFHLSFQKINLWINLKIQNINRINKLCCLNLKPQPIHQKENKYQKWKS
jgi:hypothetical protein